MNKNVRYNGYILYEWQVKKKNVFQDSLWIAKMKIMT